jgi:hypothetical protein
MGNKVLWTLGTVAGVLLLTMGGIEYWRWSVDRKLPVNDTNLRAWRFFGLLHKYIASTADSTAFSPTRAARLPAAVTTRLPSDMGTAERPGNPACREFA